MILFGGIVGVSATKTGASHAFLWQNGKMTDLGVAVPKWEFSGAAINERGQVLVSTDNGSLLWDAGTTIRLETMGGKCFGPEGFNDLGDIVGASCLPSPNPKLQGTPHAFVWEHGLMTDLGRTGTGPSESRACAINNRRQIVGATLTGEVVRAGTPTQTAVQHAVLWTRSG
jgi:probable HAF family extracellular repeat protein